MLFVTEYVLKVIQRNGLLESDPWQLQIIQLLHLQLKYLILQGLSFWFNCAYSNICIFSFLILQKRADRTCNIT